MDICNKLPYDLQYLIGKIINKMNFKQAGDHLEENFIRYESNRLLCICCFDSDVLPLQTKNEKITVIKDDILTIISDRDPRFWHMFIIENTRGFTGTINCNKPFCNCRNITSIKDYNKAHRKKKIQRRKLRRNKR